MRLIEVAARNIIGGVLVALMGLTAVHYYKAVECQENVNNEVLFTLQNVRTYQGRLEDSQVELLISFSSPGVTQEQKLANFDRYISSVEQLQQARQRYPIPTSQCGFNELWGAPGLPGT